MLTQHEIAMNDHRAWYEKASSDPRKHLLIFQKNSLPLGFINFTEIAEGKISEWSFHTAPDSPKGSGTRLGVAALNYAFGELGLHKVCGQVLGYNERSARLHQRLGFLSEGILRDQYYDGHDYHAVLCFGLLDHEWQASQKKAKRH